MRYPAQLSTAISVRNAKIANSSAPSISHLDIDDLLDEKIAEELGEDGAADHLLAVRIGSHALQVAGRHDQQGQHGADGKQRQNRGGHAAVGAGSFDLALETEPLANHVGKARKDFAQVAAGLLLEQNGGREETAIEERHPLGESMQRQIERGAEVLLVEQGAELLAERIGQFLADHLQADAERVTGAHGARQEVERFGELLLEHGEPLGTLLPDRKSTRLNSSHVS